jgi:acyl dehydratase
MKKIRYDDIAGLKAETGREFGPPCIDQIVTADKVRRFADLTGDDAWFHFDAERCRRESPFGQPIAHGLLTLSLNSLLPLATDFDVVGYGVRTNYGVDRLRYTSAVPVGAGIQTRSRLSAVRAKPSGTQLEHEVEVRLAHNGKLVMTFRPLTLLLPPVEGDGSSR